MFSRFLHRLSQILLGPAACAGRLVRDHDSRLVQTARDCMPTTGSADPVITADAGSRPRKRDAKTLH